VVWCEQVWQSNARSTSALFQVNENIYFNVIFGAIQRTVQNTLPQLELIYSEDQSCAANSIYYKLVLNIQKMYFCRKREAICKTRYFQAARARLSQFKHFLPKWGKHPSLNETCLKQANKKYLPLTLPSIARAYAYKHLYVFRGNSRWSKWISAITQSVNSSRPALLALSLLQVLWMWLRVIFHYLLFDSASVIYCPGGMRHHV